MTSAEVGVGVIGGGVMARELAAAIGRWDALADHPVRPVLRAACDPDPARLAWFQRVGTVQRRTRDYREVLDDPAVEVVYLAVPHHLHEPLYLDTIAAGKDFLGEKPFGIDEAAATRIVAALSERPRLFARCSSQMPYFPGAQLALAMAASGALGPVIEAEFGFLHSGDLDPSKPIDWKRQARFCGDGGVLTDLGMHVLHIPLRLGWWPHRVYGEVQNLVPRRPDGHGRLVPCDTPDNATLHCQVGDSAVGWFPLTLATKRIAPAELNTWRLRMVGMDGAVLFSTRHPKTVRRFSWSDGTQVWEDVEVGSQSAFATITEVIFEFGFADAVLQMWAAYLAERHGALEGRFGCATPQEALAAHRVVSAALRSSANGTVEPVPGRNRRAGTPRPPT